MHFAILDWILSMWGLQLILWFMLHPENVYLRIYSFCICIISFYLPLVTLIINSSAWNFVLPDLISVSIAQMYAPESERLTRLMVTFILSGAGWCLSYLILYLLSVGCSLHQNIFTFFTYIFTEDLPVSSKIKLTFDCEVLSFRGCVNWNGGYKESKSFIPQHCSTNNVM